MEAGHENRRDNRSHSKQRHEAHLKLRRGRSGLTPPRPARHAHAGPDDQPKRDRRYKDQKTGEKRAARAEGRIVANSHKRQCDNTDTGNGEGHREGGLSGRPNRDFRLCVWHEWLISLRPSWTMTQLLHKINALCSCITNIKIILIYFAGKGVAVHPKSARSLLTHPACGLKRGFNHAPLQLHDGPRRQIIGICQF